MPTLRSLAGVLPPRHLAGLECRLHADDGRVDFQQGILASDVTEPARLLRFLETNASLGEAWHRVRAFVRR